MQQTTKLSIAAVTLAFTFNFTLSAKTTIASTQRDAQTRFADIKLLTAQAEDQAERLNATIAAANFTPAYARERLQNIRREINLLGQNIDNLLQARQLLPFAEREALLKSIPALEDAAASVRTVISSYNESAHASWFLQNRELAKRIQADTERAHDLLARAQKLESTIEHENRAAAKLNQALNN